MALPTANLNLTAIATVLGCADDLRVCCASAAVNEDGLDPVYCPGADSATRLSNLRADKKQSYFKGYNHTALLSIDLEDTVHLIPPGTTYDFHSTLALCQQAWSEWQTYGGYSTGFMSYANNRQVGSNIWLDSGGTIACPDGFYLWNDIYTIYTPWKRLEVLNGIINNITLV